MNSSNTHLFESAGKKTGIIDFKISHRIIQLFSEGLYSSPNKAVEELVSNSFDAGAENVHIILSPDLHDPDATIAVIDDGEGMNDKDLKSHWIVGKSNKRNGGGHSNRKPIGKFGIGKLSTYVLASKLTHISKSGSTYYAATMDYSEIEKMGDSGGVFDEENIEIPLRKLSKNEAQDAVSQWANKKNKDHETPNLFGNDAPKSWTVSIMSQLKDMGKRIKRGRLEWILKTAMPQRSDFRLFLDGAPIASPKNVKPVAKIILGKDIAEMPRPCPKGLVKNNNDDEPENSIHRYGVYHSELLGRITGYIEVFADELDIGKEKFERSNGFFVYVRGRRVNIDDPGFGIDRKLLRHGTFSRFRMIVHIDSLDDALRSSRESLQQGNLYEETQNFLQASFNYARNRLEKFDKKGTSASRISTRIFSGPGSIARKPLLVVARMFMDNKAAPFYLRFPTDLSDDEKTDFLSDLEKKLETEDGFIRSIKVIELDSKEGLAALDLHRGELLINSSHPFIAAFQETFTAGQHELPFQMLVVSEILMEAHLYHMGFDEEDIHDIVGRRDELLRQLVKSSARRTAGMIALALENARNDGNRLEEEVRAAFEAIGFDNVIRIGGPDNPDGTAEAYLAARENDRIRGYKVGLEAKSGGIVSANRLDVSAIERHMEKYKCNHHLVIGNGFRVSKSRKSASVRSIKLSKRKNGKTITLMHIEDLARLVRIVSTKRVGGLSRLRTLFIDCITPDECKAWIDDLVAEPTEDWPYKEILETIWKLAQRRPDEAVAYDAVKTELEHCNPPVIMRRQELIECCKAMHVIAKDVVFAQETTVEIDRIPALILKDIKSAIEQYPEGESGGIRI